MPFEIELSLAKLVELSADVVFVSLPAINDVLFVVSLAGELAFVFTVVFVGGAALFVSCNKVTLSRMPPIT